MAGERKKTTKYWVKKILQTALKLRKNSVKKISTKKSRKMVKKRGKFILVVHQDKM